MNKIVVTGANGFVGRRLSHAMSLKGFEVFRILRPGPPEDELRAGDIVLDLQDASGVEQALYELRPECVIHLAGTRNRGDTLDDYLENYQGNLLNSLNVIMAARNLPSLKRFVFTGSCDEYGSCRSPFHEGLREEPNNAYGLSKLAVTQLVALSHRMQGFPSVILRPSVVYGPGQGHDMFIPSLATTLASGSAFAMTYGEQVRDFIYVDDLVTALIRAAEHSSTLNGSLINIGSGTSYRIRDVALMVADLIGPNSRELLRFGAIPYRSNEIMNYSLSIDQAQNLLGWSPSTLLPEGLEKTVATITGNVR